MHTTSKSSISNWLPDLSPSNPFQLLNGLLDASEFFTRLRDKLTYHGMYDILSYEAHLEIADPQGEWATLTRREVIRFRQDNVVAIHDHAWGDGELFAKYRCQPGLPVDIYQDGSKYNVLISLRETKNRGDVVDLWVERGIRNGLRKEHEWFETEIDHWTKELDLAIVFPRGRPCRRATLSRRSTEETSLLLPEHFAHLPDGRQKLTYNTARPKLHDRYTIKWIW